MKNYLKVFVLGYVLVYSGCRGIVNLGGDRAIYCGVYGGCFAMLIYLIAAYLDAPLKQSQERLEQAQRERDQAYDDLMNSRKGM